MLGRTSPDLSELAYHIVSLWAFWERSHVQKGEAIRAIKPMIVFYFGAEDADSIAHTIVTALEATKQVNPFDQAEGEECKIELISSFLQKQTVDSSAPKTTAYWQNIFSSKPCVDSLSA